MEAFEVGGMMGARRFDAFSAGDVVRVKHIDTGRMLAMKRVQVTEELGDANDILQDLTRSAGLTVHEHWLPIYAELSFVHEYTDRMRLPQARVCIVEELAESNLEQEIINRAVENRPFEGLLCTFAGLLHALQAFHAQGCLHRDVCPRNIFFKDGSPRLGPPGPACFPSVTDYYAGGECPAYSADMFALGLVFLQMALLHPLADMAVALGTSVLEEISKLDGSASSLRSWLDERCSLLGLQLVSDSLFEVFAATFAFPVTARPTTDDLLDLPMFAEHADPSQMLPVRSRPCVVMAHGPSASALCEVPRRHLLSVPWLHQLFSTEGSEQASREGRYHWCGREHKLWWFEDDFLPIPCALAEPEEPTESQREAFNIDAGNDPTDALINMAKQFRFGGSLVSAEACLRSALATGNGGLDIWLGLAATLFERGHISAARGAFQQACSLSAESCIKESLSDAEATPRSTNNVVPLSGLCEFFAAVDTLREQSNHRSDVDGALRAGHVGLYYRSSIAQEEANWEVFAGIGEFYRLVGCPKPPFCAPSPDLATSASYFEQAFGIEPRALFVKDRLARIAGDVSKVAVMSGKKL